MSKISSILQGNKIKKIVILVAAIALASYALITYFNKSANNETIADVALEIDRNMNINSVDDVEKVIAYWIDQNPEAIIQSVTKLQQKAMAERMKDAQKNIATKKREIFDSKQPSYSPKGYDVTIVEFYDYNCGYCRQANKIVEELISSDKKVRVIYRDFPILGDLSRKISEVSIAASITDKRKFRKFHNELMSNRIKSQEEAIKLASKVGINVSKLKRTLKNKKSQIDKTLQDNIVLGSTIGINGTPAFVIGEELIPGAVDAATLRDKIKSLR